VAFCLIRPDSIRRIFPIVENTLRINPSSYCLSKLITSIVRSGGKSSKIFEVVFLKFSTVFGLDFSIGFSKDLTVILDFSASAFFAGAWEARVILGVTRLKLEVAPDGGFLKLCLFNVEYRDVWLSFEVSHWDWLNSFGYFLKYRKILSRLPVGTLIGWNFCITESTVVLDIQARPLESSPLG
jgi:hypothetical protein